MEDLLNERHHLPHLDLHKVAPTLLGYLDERVTRHVLYTVMRLYNNKMNCHTPCPVHRHASLQ